MTVISSKEPTLAPENTNAATPSTTFISLPISFPIGYTAVQNRSTRSTTRIDCSPDHIAFLLFKLLALSPTTTTVTLTARAGTCIRLDEEETTGGREAFGEFGEAEALGRCTAATFYSLWF